MSNTLQDKLKAAMELCYSQYTLETLNSDSLQNARNRRQLLGLDDKVLSRVLSVEAPQGSSQNQKAMKPHANMVKSEQLAPLSGSRACGAACKRTAKPCKSPAMKGKKRCRLHGGKSTGRPITNGLQAHGFKKRKQGINNAMANILQAALNKVDT